MSVEADLRRAVGGAMPRLLALSEAEASRSPSPGKWSPRQVIGHLVDSASNNHQRFVRAQLTDDLVFPGYDQDVWVSLQRYDAAPWTELVELFRTFNLHLARVIEAVPEAVREKPRPRHNLHLLAFRPVPESEAATLGYFMRDYVEHLEHHLAQVSGSAAAAPPESVTEVAPIFRIFDEAKARDFYVGFLGFQVDWENRFEPDTPIYMQVSRGPIRLHLSEHHGDACPGSTLFVRLTGLDAYHREVMSKGYRYNRPGLDETPWGTRQMQVIDPFGNRIRFNEDVA